MMSLTDFTVNSEVVSFFVSCDALSHPQMMSKLAANTHPIHRTFLYLPGPGFGENNSKRLDMDTAQEAPKALLRKRLSPTFIVIRLPAKHLG
jgi:hypothetical protein